MASLREPRTTIGGVNVVAGFRPELWAGVAPDDAPPGLTGFNEPLIGPTGYELPPRSTTSSIWLTGAGYDVVFDLSRAVVRGLCAASRDLANEMVGWPYHHDLDLTGFIDGTENPTLVEATTVALDPAGLPGRAVRSCCSSSGSTTRCLGVAARAEQEPSSGGARPTAPSSTRGRRAPTSRRTDQEEFGKIFRRNIAYGTLGRHGTIFVGFCARSAPSWPRCSRAWSGAGGGRRRADGVTRA